MTLCEKCHDGFHMENNGMNDNDISVLSELSDISSGKVKKQHRKVKTTKGIKLQEV